MWLWSVHNVLSLLLLHPSSLSLLQYGVPLMEGNTSQTDPIWVSHGLQFFKSCSSICPYEEVLSISGIDTAPEWSAVYELQFHKPCMWSPWVAASFRTCPLAVVLAPPQAAVWINAPMWSSMGCKGDNLLHLGPLHGMQGKLLQCLELLLLLHWPLCLQGSLTFFSQLLYNISNPFLYMYMWEVLPTSVMGISYGQHC